ncbi:hypothetical protein BCh11DRAFT_00010 [Burkholderia sp. Ch1-1]|nr:hypothetical protein BCh11DRAFT_00010 [Burkholderia sp. Ch1-1]
MKLEQQALSTMAAPGPDLDAGSPATTLSDVAAHPPQYDQNYVQNLAAGYRGVLRDTELQNRVMLRKPIPGLADQVLYGIGRFAADLSPIPGLDWFANQLLDVQFPDHGGLSDQQVKNVDMGAMFTGLLLGRGEPEGEALLKPPVVGHGEAPGGGPGEVHGTGSGTESRTDGGTGPTQEPPPGMTAPQAGPAANGPQGQPPQGGAGSAFTPGGMPKGYALNRAPASYGPSATPGVYADAANGQKFIIADGQAFAVRYDKENATYRIYDPANPSRPTYPVRRDPETGRWEIHNNVGLQGGVGRLPAETRQKAEALLRDGWTIVNTADRLGIGEFSVRAIRKSLNLAVFPSPPLASNSLRQTVMARLNAGASRVEIARDMHIQPETVDLIGGYWRGPMAHRALPIREDQRAAGAQQPAASSGLRGPASPQPGTSTGGHTHPSARHPYVDEPQPRPIDPVAARGLRRADATKLSEKTGQKAKALIRDGWANSAVGRELRMSVNTVAKIKQTMDPADFLSPALKSLTLPGEVIARLDAGIPGAQIAQEMHLQPETVDRIDREYRADRLAADLYRARMARAPAGADQAAESSGLRRPASPQPGASTGGHTHPPAKRQCVDEPQIAGEDPMTSEVLRQLTNQIPAERIAQNMQLRPDVVNAIIDRYVKSEARKLHQEFLAEQASQPAAAAGAQPVSPAHRQEVIRQLGEGHTSAEIAARMNLTVYQVEEITNQHLREEIARFHPDPAQ